MLEKADKRAESARILVLESTLRTARSALEDLLLRVAQWCDAIETNGASWDDWDRHYKRLAYHGLNRGKDAIVAIDAALRPDPPPYCNQAGFDRINEQHKRIAALEAALRKARGAELKCERTKNLCGTDTEPMFQTCQCSACQVSRVLTAALKGMEG